MLYDQWLEADPTRNDPKVARRMLATEENAAALLDAAGVSELGIVSKVWEALVTWAPMTDDDLRSEIGAESGVDPVEIARLFQLVERAEGKLYPEPVLLQAHRSLDR